ncbi:translocation/assembly module TamB domain-containing protein [Sulfitobacter aestuariivivens]|uniref:Translocation/assembly module TamB domain-containing protein n=1 Tax=Sulfitobacter aestuariivivens TaxID=2766981 RepID=A0A927CZS7_9RHOB|nr:translocation/assembly module TamB domain-containing protein [Sulfitobacter aestuariivivens]MBD3662420.1 translocation/assembly module TamB domain-containing protein [Sulfitobacter aestuariivivens]
MRAPRYIVTAFLIWLASLVGVAAQEDDKGFLTRTIQDALSGTGRTVSIDGFAGALSSEASFDRMTIADKDGIWLTLEDVVLVWNRSALLRGRLEVERLRAGRLDLPRLPVSEDDALPDAEATPFSLPDLPVSIDIAEFAIDQINLGAPLLGEDAQLSINAQARYTDAEAFADFTAERTDGKRGAFEVKADLNRSDDVLSLLIKLSEEEEGLAARLLNLPGQPSVDMTVAGDGLLDDFTSDVTIATDGQERLAGQIVLSTQAPRRASDHPDRRVQADIGGDITALLAPRFRAFFGEDVQLTLDALREGSGAFEISDFALTAQAAQLQGKANINQEGWPTLLDITGSIRNPDGTPILLPVGGEGTTVEAVQLRVDYDAGDGEVFDADFTIDALATQGITITQTQLALDGTLQGNLGSVGQFLGDVTFAAEGLALTDPAQAEAIGDAITGRANINYIEGQPTRISNLDLSGTDYSLAGQVIINGLEQGFLTRLDVALQASDLSRFSALIGREIDGQTGLALKGSVTPLGGLFDLQASGTTQDLRVGIAQADAVLAGRTEVSVAAQRNETGTFLRDLALENDAISLTGSAELRTDDSRAQARFTLADVGLVVPEYSGPVTVTATATQDNRGWTIDAATDGPYGAQLTAKGLATGPNAALTITADAPNVTPFAAPFDQDISGPLRAEGVLRNSADGWLLRADGSGPFGGEVSVDGQITPRVDMQFDVSLPDIQPLVPQVKGPLSAEGRVRQEPQGFFIDATASGPYRGRAAVEGLATGPDMQLTFEVLLPDVRPVVPGVSGPLNASGVVRQTPDGIAVDTNASGPYGAQANVAGIATGPQMRLTFDLALPNVNPVVPGMSGPLNATGVVRQTPDGIAVDTNATGPYASRGSLQGVVTGPNANVDFTLAMANIGALVEKVSGPLDVTGSAAKSGGGWQVSTQAQGPSGTQATITGQVSEAGTAALDIVGTAPLGLSRPFIAPRNLQGQARFDLRLDGPLALSSLSGTIQTTGASLSAPNLRVAVTGINGNVQLAQNRAQVDLTGEATNGGRVRVGGGITLTGALPADLRVGLQDVVLIDPRLYRTSVSGDLRVAGPLTGGAVIAGRVNVAETTVNVPSTGLTSIGDIPPITHIGARPGVAATRQRAGLTGAGAGDDPASGGDGPGFGLDVRVNAPNRIFVRGRGLDAELGGALTLTGTTNRIISTGRFELLRGRLDILGKRFNLVEGFIQFQGDLIPFIRFVSVTDSATGEVRIIVEGPADAPEVKFEATPEAPEDEVLAQLLFGRSISDISAFQALQLASAVATLAGRGGGGLIGNLREGFGLDDLDVTTTEDGATALRVGKYISDNIYTDVTAASDGTGEVSLNLDISKNLTARGTLESDGNTSIGIFFEKDY